MQSSQHAIQVPTKDSSPREFQRYYQAILSGASNTFRGMLDTIVHPVDNVVYPAYALLHDANIIAAEQHIQGSTINPFGIDAESGVLQYVIIHNPQILTDTTHRMQERKETISGIGNIIANGSGPQRVEMATSIAVSALVPGWIVSGAKMVSNLRKFGSVSRPPLFHNIRTDDLIIPPPPIPRILPKDIINQKNWKDFMYVITSDGELIISPEKFPKPIQIGNGTFSHIAHPEIAQLKPVYASGTVTVQNGKIVGIDNYSGHYLPHGAHLNTLVEKVFAAHGFQDVQGLFRPVKELSTAKNITYDSFSTTATAAKAGAVFGLLKYTYKEPNPIDAIYRPLIAQQLQQTPIRTSRIDSSHLFNNYYDFKSVAPQNNAYNFGSYSTWNGNGSTTTFLNSSSHLFNKSYIDLYTSWRVRDAVQRATWSPHRNYFEVYMDAYSRLGYPTNFDFSAFRNVLRSTGLVSSYNSIHPFSKVKEGRGYRGEIGGVATQIGMIEGVKNSPAQVLFENPIFCLETVDEKMPFDNAELKQILRELTQGIYINNTYPFFSLHFNDNGTLYPVIHPAYQNTLVGKVIGLLDYYMKCYLNGGYFEESFLTNWHIEQKSDKEYLKLHRKDLKKYCKEAKLAYISLREHITRMGLDDAKESKNSFSASSNKFRTSFRIIAEQKEIQSHQNIFVINPDFKVEYTVDLAPDYKEYLDHYVKEHGQYPDDYQTLLNIYEQMAISIKRDMPKLPFCRDYFQMLGVISFFCYYLTTLKEMDRVPVLTPDNRSQDYHFPKALPPIPVRHYKFFPVTISIREVFQNLSKKIIPLMNQWLLDAFEHPDINFPEELVNEVHNVIKKLLIGQLPVEMGGEDSDVYMRLYEVKLLEGLITEVRRSLANNRILIIHELEGLIKELELECKLNRTEKLIDQIATVKQKMEKKLDEFISVSLQAYQRKLNEIQKQNFLNEMNSKKKESLEGIETMIQGFKNLATKMFCDEGCKQTLQYQYPLGTLDIADDGFYKENGDHHTVIGGCSVTLPNIHPSPIPLETSLRSSLLPVLRGITNESFASVEHAGKKMAVFKIQTQHRPAYSVLDYCDLNESISLPQEQTKLGEKEFQFLGQYMEAEKVEVKSNFNARAKDQGGQTLVHYAVSLPTQSQLLDRVINEEKSALMETDNHGNLPIHTAAAQGNKVGVNFIVTKMPQCLDAKNQEGQTALLMATQSGHKSVVEQLVNMGANINYRLPNGLFALYVAIQNGDAEIALAIIPKANVNFHVDSGSTALHLSTDAEMHDVSLALIKAGADLAAKRRVDEYTPFHNAVQRGSIDVCSAMIATGKVNVNSPLSSGKRPLHLAAAEGHLEVIQLLVESKTPADINLQDENGETVLMVAIQSGHIEVALYLAERSKINIKNKNGETASLMALKMHQYEVADRLFRRDENVLLPDLEGYNAIYYLLINGEYHRYKYLKSKNKLNINHKFNGETPLAIVMKQGHLLLADLLMEQKAEIETREKGWKLMHYAAKTNHMGLLKAWLKLNSDASYPIESGLDQGKTLLYIAAENGHEESLKELLKYAQPFLITSACNSNHLLVAAVKSGSQQVIEMVLTYCADSNIALDKTENTVAHYAAIFGLTGLVDFFVGCGVVFAKANNNQHTAFHIAILNGDVSLLKKLYEITPKEKIPQGLYLFAYQHNKVSVIKELHKPSDIEKNKALIYACREGRLKDVQGLLAEGVVPSEDKAGDHPLLVAVSQNHLGIINRLLSVVTDMGILNAAFHQAYLSDQIEVLRLFIELNIISQSNINAYFSLRKFTKAAIKQDFDTIERSKTDLLKAIEQSDHVNFNKLVNGKYSLDRFPVQQAWFNFRGQKIPLLHCAFKMKAGWAIEVLLKAGVDPLIRDMQGNTIIHKLNMQDVDELKTDLQLIDKYFTDGPRTRLWMSQTIDKHTVIDIALASKQIIHLYDRFKKEGLVYQHPDGNSLLHAVVLNDDYSMIEKLISEGCNVNALNRQMRTPLMMAVQKGNLKVVQLLLNHGGDPNLVDIKQNNCLHIATFEGHTKVAMQVLHHMTLIDRRSRSGNTAFMYAAAKGLQILVNVLAERGSDIHAINFNGQNAIHLAAAYGYEKVIARLGELGMDMDDLLESNPYTPLQLAARHGQVNAFKQLILCGADPVKKSKLNHTAIDYAVISNNGELIDYVMQLPCINKTEVLNNAFFAAVEGEAISVLSQLLATGFSISIIREDGSNALHRASIGGASKSVAFLLEQGIDPNMRDHYGNSPLHDAVRGGSISVAKQLCDANSDVDAQDDNGMTPLHIAAETRNYAMILQLLKESANPDLENKNGLRPAQIAMLNDDWKLAKTLMVMGDKSYRKDAAKELTIHHQLHIQKFELQLAKIAEAAGYSQNLFDFSIHAEDSDALILLCKKYPEILRSEQQRYILHTAVIQGNLEAVKVILDHYPESVRVINSLGYNVLTLALRDDFKLIAKYLISAGVRLEQGNDSKNQFQAAIDQEDGFVMLKLLHHGIKLTLKDMESILQSRKLMEYYQKFIFENDQGLAAQISNSRFLSSQTIKNLTILIKKFISSLTTTGDQEILQFTLTYIQKMIELNKQLLDVTKIYSKQLALKATFNELASISTVLHSSLQTIKEAKRTVQTTNKDYFVLYVLKKWQDLLSKPIHFNSRFDYGAHLSFFTFPGPSSLSNQESHRRCVIS